MPRLTGMLGLGGPPIPIWFRSHIQLPEMTPVLSDGRSLTSKMVVPLRPVELLGVPGSHRTRQRGTASFISYL